MSPLVLGILILDIILLGCVVALRYGQQDRRWRLTDVLLGWHTLYWIGTCGLLFWQPDYETIRFITFVMIAQLSISSGALLVGLTQPKQVLPSPELLPAERFAAYSILFLCTVVCGLFVWLVVANDELSAMLAGVATGDRSFLDYRITMSRGKAVYLAPGYIKQFRDVLLPTTLLALLTYTQRPRWWVVAAAAGMGTAAAVLSGERSVIMIYVFVLGMGAVLRPGRSPRARRLIVGLVGASVFGVFIVATVLLGRSTTGITPAGLLVESAGGLFDRAVLTVPRENALGFPVWGEQAPTWGTSWSSALGGIMPGSQAGLDNELHVLLGGGEDGNAPLGLPADAYLAFGVLGVAIVPLAFILMLAMVDRALLESPLAIPRALRVVLVPLSFGWYSPYLFILNGGIVLLFAGLVATAMPRQRTAVYG